MDKEQKIKVFDVATQSYVEVKKVEKSNEEWKMILSDEQYRIAREHGTEAPFSYPHLHRNEKGYYECVACGNDLFSSETKFDSKTGWPSFYKPVAEENVEEEMDYSLFMKRVEIKCSRCGAHLGHVFEDGPEPTGLRYCINGEVLKFIEDKKTSNKTNDAN